MNNGRRHYTFAKRRCSECGRSLAVPASPPFTFRRHKTPAGPWCPNRRWYEHEAKP